jgi:uncharacterized protein
MTTEGIGAGESPPRASTTRPMVSALRIPANRVSRRAISYWTARAVLGAVTILLVEVGFAWAAKFSVEWRAALTVTAVVLAVRTVIMPRWRYRVHRWEVTDQALYTRSGWFSVHWRIAPISRIQTIDSHRSLGERIFALANVTATTASAAGPVRIHGLDRALADRLLDQLAVATGQVPGDAT